jgi:hypothetical protein
MILSAGEFGRLEFGGFELDSFIFKNPLSLKIHCHSERLVSGARNLLFCRKDSTEIFPFGSE